MPAFNAEAVIKTVEKRLDKLEAAVEQLEKSVKVLIDTRGDSKADAVRKLEQVVAQQAKEIDAVPAAQIKAIQDAMKASRDEFDKLRGEDRRDAKDEFEKQQAEFSKLLQRKNDELSKAHSELSERMTRLNDEAQALDAKRDQAYRKEQQEILNKLVENAKAQGEAMKNAALLEARFLKLETLVNVALAKK